MGREKKAPTHGSSFCRILKKDETGQWYQVLMVYNLAKAKGNFLKPPGFGLPGGGVLTIEKPAWGVLRELYEETGKVFNVGDPLLLQGLDRLTKEIEKWDEGSSRLEMAVRARCQILEGYAERALKLGLLRPLPDRTETDNESPVWIFETDAEKLFPPEEQDDPHRWLTFESPVDKPNHCVLRGYRETRASCRNDLAKNTKFSIWFPREQLEEVAGNSQRFNEHGPDHDATRVYAGHLRRLDLDVLKVR